MRCVTKSLELRRGGKRRKKRERKKCVREQLREDEHEYAGLVLRAREGEGQRERIARERATKREIEDEERGRDRRRWPFCSLLIPRHFLCLFQPAWLPPV